MNVTLVGKRVFADVINFRIFRCEHHSGWSCWALNPVTSVLIRDTQGRVDGQKGTQKREMQGEGDRGWRDGAMSHGSWGTPAALEAERGEGRSSPRAPRPGAALPTPSFGFLASKTVREYISLVLSHLLCGNLYHNPRNLVQWGVAFHVPLFNSRA